MRCVVISIDYITISGGTIELTQKLQGPSHTGICSLTEEGNDVIFEINRMHMSDMGPYLLKYKLSVKDGKVHCEKISEEYYR